MTRNIQAVRVILRGDEVRIQALSESRRGTRFIKDSVVISRRGLEQAEFISTVEGAIAQLLIVPERES